MALTLLTRIRDQWQRLPTNRQLALLVIIAGIVGTLLIWGVLSSQVSYQVAFSNLQPSDASAVVTKLHELQIPYQMEDGANGTTTIQVPSSLVNEARVQVAGAGVLKGSSVGFEIFDQPSFGLSDFIQQVDYQRALEGELARSISQIDGIDSARVHLAIPQPSVFVSQQQSPSAAVVIGLKPGYQMDSAHAQAIVDLVVGAVQGMKPDQVVLLDTSGNLLHQTQSASGINVSTLDNHLAVQQSMEHEQAAQLQSMLDRVLGPGHSTVQVNLQLDWTSGEATSDNYSPNGQPPQVTSDQELRDYVPPGTTAGGIAGVTSNIPSYQGMTATTPISPTATISSTNGLQRVQSNLTYQLSHVVKKTQIPPGTITRVSVAIAVDSSVANAAMIANLTKMAQGAVGYDSARGDVVSVVPVTFKSATPIAPAPLAAVYPYLPIAQIAAMVIGPVLAILVLALLVRGRGRRDEGPTVLTMPVGALPPASSPLRPNSPMVAMESRKAFMREHLRAIAEDDPAHIAAMLQTWVKEESGD